MPSPVGHALGGLAVAWSADLVAPVRQGAATTDRERAATRLALACMVLAVVPDLDLLFRVHRTFTHSLSAVALVAAASVLAAARLHRSTLRLSLVCAAAYGTHLLLDWMAADAYFPYGIQLLWPVSRHWFISGWDLFAQTERRHPFSRATLAINVPAVAREVAILGPLVAALWLVRVKALARLPAQTACGDEAAK